MIDLRVPARTRRASGTSTTRPTARAHAALAPETRDVDVMRRHRELFGPLTPNQIRGLLSQALLSGDRETARRIYYAYIVPDHGFSHGEVGRLAYRVGAIDEGDSYLAARADL
jgi:hypothetical protein